MARKEADPRDESVYQLRLTLQETEPPIWRRVLVPADVTLAGLHRVIQATMGWEDQHLWRFQIGDAEYSDAPVEGWGEPMREASVRLHEVAGPGDVLLYEYDLGDSWEHRIQVEAVRPREPGRVYPVCTTAERACPPENCGGVPGYEDLLEVLADPNDPEHESLREWLGGPFDPQTVSVDEVNRRLARTEPRVKGAAPGGSGSAHPGNPAEAAMRELRSQAEALVQEVLEENPEATIDDLNAVLQGSLSGYNLRPQSELGGLSPAQMQRLLSADWESPSSAVQLDSTLSLAELEGSRTLHNARRFLQLLARGAR